MSLLETPKEIEIIKEGGKKLSSVFGRVLEKITVGAELEEIDRLAEELIKEEGGFPSFKTVKGYHWATCININEGVVHGIPNNYRIKEGDLVSLDMGMLYRGFHTDMARTIIVGKKNRKNNEIYNFLKIGKTALKEAVKAARGGRRVGHISLAIEKVLRKAGLNPIEALGGHGVGRKLHDYPHIPCFLEEEIVSTPPLIPGMVLAIEVIYTQGSSEVYIKKDGWTVSTVDGKLAGLFEDTVLVTEKRPIVLTTLAT